jgi:hypothetical protein
MLKYFIEANHSSSEDDVLQLEEYELRVEQQVLRSEQVELLQEIQVCLDIQDV